MKAVTMPKWHAGLLFAAPTACPYPAATNPPPGEESVYRALGQEPDWTVTITRDRFDYAGEYAEPRIDMPHPDPRATLNSHRSGPQPARPCDRTATDVLSL